MLRLIRVTAVLLMALSLAACGGEKQPEAIRQGRTIYGDICSTCHGDAGDGGVGPALDEVTETWPQCSDHVEWITLGSEGWKANHGDSYGATAKPVNGGMPPQGENLTLDEIRKVAAFERSQYGGEDTDVALSGCEVS